MNLEFIKIINLTPHTSYDKIHTIFKIIYTTNNLGGDIIVEF